MNTPRPIPNTAPASNDVCLTPIEVTVSMVLIDDGTCKRWHPETMDRLAADRFVEAIRAAGGSGTAVIVEVPIVLPAADQIDDIWSDLDCEPVRIEMTETPRHDAFAELFEQFVKEQTEKTGKSPLKNPPSKPAQRRRYCR